MESARIQYEIMEWFVSLYNGNEQVALDKMLELGPNDLLNYMYENDYYPFPYDETDFQERVWDKEDFEYKVIGFKPRSSFPAQEQAVAEDAIRELAYRIGKENVFKLGIHNRLNEEEANALFKWVNVQSNNGLMGMRKDQVNVHRFAHEYGMKLLAYLLVNYGSRPGEDPIWLLHEMIEGED